MNRRMSLHRKLLALVACAALGPADRVLAADHLDAPLLTGNGAVDINDVYAFQSPANPENTVLIMTVNPFAGTMSGRSFNTSAAYELLIDNTGDALADVTYTATFSSMAGVGQTLMLAKDGANIVTGGTGASLSLTGGGMVQAGLFDDPFFFDLAGFQDELNFTGVDAFAGADISAIVLEIPTSELGGPDIGVWARTMVGGTQMDRMGRPAINTVLIPEGRKDEFNAAQPAQDPTAFGADVRATIESLSGDAGLAASLTDVLLPDVLTFNTSDAGGFLNGRQLADDVIDAELGLLTDGAVTGDGVDGNDVPFRNMFPYLAVPNGAVPEPSSLAIAVLGASAFGLLANRRRRRILS